MRRVPLGVTVLIALLFQWFQAFDLLQNPVSAASPLQPSITVPASGLTHRVIPLGTLDGVESRAFGVHESGLAAGDDFIPDPDPRTGLGEYCAFRWEGAAGDNQSDDGRDAHHPLKSDFGELLLST